MIITENNRIAIIRYRQESPFCSVTVPLTEIIKLVTEVITYTRPPINPPAVPAFLGKYSILVVKNDVNKTPEQI